MFVNGLLWYCPWALRINKQQKGGEVIGQIYCLHLDWDKVEVK